MQINSRRWICLSAGILVEFCIGIGYAWSVFQNPLVNQFGWATTSVSIAFTLSTAMGVLAPLIGKLQDYLKPRWLVLIGGIVYSGCLIGTGFVQSLAMLYLVYGLGVGLGMTMVYPLLIAYMVKLFPEKSGLVSGVMVASYGSGAVIWAPVGAALTATYGVSAAFKMLGLVFLISISLLSRLIGDLSESNPLEGAKAHEAKSPSATGLELSWRQMMRTPLFYAIFLMFVTGTTAGLMILGHASPILQEVLQMTPQRAALIVGVFSVVNACGRLLAGWLSDQIGRYPILTGLFGLVTLALVTLAATHTAFLYIAALLLVGLCYGGFIALIAPLTADSFGARQLSVNYGIMFIAFALGGIMGPRLAAVVKEANQGEYIAAFIIAATLCLLGGLIAGCLWRRERKLRASAAAQFQRKFLGVSDRRL